MDSMDNMKICPQCGGEVKSTAKFCGECGYRFPTEETVQSPVETGSVNELKIPAPPVIESFVAPTPVQPVNSGLGATTPEQPANSGLGASTPEQPANSGLGAPTPEQPINSGLGAPMPEQPVNSGLGAPTPEQPINSGLGAPMPGQPINSGLGAPMPGQPINSGLGAATPEQPINSGLGAATPVQPASGSYGAQTYTQPSYPPYSPVQPPQKKGKGGLIALFSILGVLVLAGTVLVAGFLAGWFQKKEIVLSETKVTVIVEEEVTIKVENYKDIGKPDLTATVQEGKEDYIEVEVKGDKIIITGVEEGKNITVTISAKGCEDVSFKVTVEEPEEEDEVELSGTAWDAEGFKYYFFENGTMYMISEEQENYIKGTYTTTSLTQEKAENYAGGEDPFSSISDGVYFLVKVDVEQELFYGNEYEEDDYYLVVCTNGKKCEIYDSIWNYVSVGSTMAMESESDLDSYFESASSGGGGTVPSGSITSGSVQGINFGRAANVKETWHIAKYESNNGDILFFKKDGNLWGINENGGNAVQLTSLGEGLQVTIFAVYEDYLFYGVGLKEEGGEEIFYASTSAFYKVDLINDDITMLSDDIDLKDFVIYDDNIYYTDYSVLYKMDFDGNIETLYDEYGLFTFEVTDDYIFIFDGYAWVKIDPEDGTDYGYITISNGEYEADVVRDEDEILFFTIYNYDEGNIYLYAMDHDGNVTQIGDADWGETWDTYNVVFDDKYVIYTVHSGEVIVKADVTSGSYETMTLSDYDYYYATGMVQWGDDIYLYVWDDYGDAHYLELDVDDLSVEEIPGVTAQ